MRRPGGAVAAADSSAIGSSSALPGHHLDTARIHRGFTNRLEGLPGAIGRRGRLDRES